MGQPGRDPATRRRVGRVAWQQLRSEDLGAESKDASTEPADHEQQDPVRERCIGRERADDPDWGDPGSSVPIEAAGPQEQPGQAAPQPARM